MNETLNMFQNLLDKFKYIVHAKRFYMKNLIGKIA